MVSGICQHIFRFCFWFFPVKFLKKLGQLINNSYISYVRSAFIWKEERADILFKKKVGYWLLVVFLLEGCGSP